ncbi:MAG TPA: helix-turn-helix domain-containing protein [Beutenbergiaceae bacterium]|nr:helix-turn-helix domain-containing protein [Beutenbergiaceae bacterium]
MKAQPPAPRFLTVAEVAEMVRVSKMTVYRMVHSGELPAIRVGKSFRVPYEEVERLLGETVDGEYRSGS